MMDYNKKYRISSSVLNQARFPASGPERKKDRGEKFISVSGTPKPQKIFSDLFFSLLRKILCAAKETPDLQFLFPCAGIVKNRPDRRSRIFSQASPCLCKSQRKHPLFCSRGRRQPGNSFSGFFRLRKFYGRHPQLPAPGSSETGALETQRQNG